MSTVIDDWVTYSCDETALSIVLKRNGHKTGLLHIALSFTDELDFFEMERVLQDAKYNIAAQRDRHKDTLNAILRHQVYPESPTAAVGMAANVLSPLTATAPGTSTTQAGSVSQSPTAISSSSSATTTPTPNAATTTSTFTAVNVSSAAPGAVGPAAGQDVPNISIDWDAAPPGAHPWDIFAMFCRDAYAATAAVQDTPNARTGLNAMANSIHPRDIFAMFYRNDPKVDEGSSAHTAGENDSFAISG
ncbi:hypothetical protein BD414DRAFT_510949 [Trametes punicea]|nr:hypothetical protein BD414DRAFT_510949 [Trametes punicea]